MADSSCRECGAATEGALLCPSCGAIQPANSDYYSALGLPVTLALDIDDLQQRFYRMSRLLHPDRFTRKPAEEQQLSLNATSVLNDALRTLRNPLERAEYVLKREGFDIGEQRTKDVPPELLEEVFELNMALEEMRSGDVSVRPQLEKAREDFLSMQTAIDAQLETLFTRYDATHDRSVLQEIRSVLNRRRYIRNLVNEVEKELVPAAQ